MSSESHYDPHPENRKAHRKMRFQCQHRWEYLRSHHPPQVGAFLTMGRDSGHEITSVASKNNAKPSQTSFRCAIMETLLEENEWSLIIFWFVNENYRWSMNCIDEEQWKLQSFNRNQCCLMLSRAVPKFLMLSRAFPNLFLWIPPKVLPTIPRDPQICVKQTKNYNNDSITKLT